MSDLLLSAEKWLTWIRFNVWHEYKNSIEYQKNGPNLLAQHLQIWSMNLGREGLNLIPVMGVSNSVRNCKNVHLLLVFDLHICFLCYTSFLLIWLPTLISQVELLRCENRAQCWRGVFISIDILENQFTWNHLINLYIFVRRHCQGNLSWDQARKFKGDR